MRGWSKRDFNQGEIERALRAWGADVVDLSRVGGGVPDLLVGFKGVDQFVEVKRPAGARGGESFSKLNNRQVAFARGWKGRPPVVVRTDSDVAALIRAIEEEVDGAQG